MADDAWRIDIPHSHDSSRLDYGHLGTASYSQDRRWTFLRQPACLQLPKNDDEVSTDQASDSTAVSFVPKLIYEPTTRLPRDDQLDHAALPATLFPSQVKLHHLSKHAPEVAFAASEIRSQLASRPTERHFSLNNQLSGHELFATGRIATFGHHRIDRSTPLVSVVAHVAPHDPAKILISLFDRHTISVVGETAADYIVPSISQNEVASWTISANPVLQVVFAKGTAEGVPGALAARSSSCTTIRQPMLYASSSRSGLSIRSQIDITIPCTQTGGAPHADVAFNPTNSEQIAIIDEYGNWSIWRIKGTHKSSLRIAFRAQLLIHGSLEADYRAHGATQNSRYSDGWHRICWLAENVILTCSRSFGIVYDITSGLKHAVDLGSGPKLIKEAVLDIASLSSFSGECFILTTSYLIWMTLDDHNFRLRRIASWAHHRSKSDLSLRLHVLERDEGTFIFISSTAGHLVVMHHVTRRPTQDGQQYSLNDPLPLNLHPHSWSGSGTHLLDIKWIQYEGHPSSRKDPLFTTFSRNMDGSIHEIVCQLSGCHKDNKVFQYHHQVTLPASSSKAHKSAMIVDDDDIDEFVVEDETLVWYRPLCLVSEDLDGAQYERSSDVCDLYGIYDAIIQSEPPLSTYDATTLQKALTLLEDRVDTIETLQLCIDPAIQKSYIAEIEDDSDLIQRWLNHLAAHNKDQSSFSISRHDERSLSEVYQKMLDGWISNLSPRIPDRSRVYKERLLRQTALQVFTSGITILNRPSEVRQIATMGRDSANTAALLSDELEDMSIRSPSKGEDHAIWSLQRYTSFFKPLPVFSTGRILTNILAHIPTSIDIDPMTYNYEDIKSNLAAKDAEAALASMDARSRRKITNATAARKRRLERQQNIRSEASQHLSSVPNIMTSSQIPIREIKSSQIMPAAGSSQPSLGGRDMPAISSTQPERGVYGSRQTSNKDKNKGKAVRAPGFK